MQLKQHKLFINYLFIIVVITFIDNHVKATPISKIVGGNIAAEHQFPYQISLQKNGGMHTCGGSILNEKFVITAAHCVLDPYFGFLLPANSLTVVSGTNSLKNGGDKFKLRKIYPHPKYGNYQNDIALLELTDQFTFNNATQPISLYDTEIGEKIEVIISGWGRIYQNGPISDDLKFNTLYAEDGAKCSHIVYIFTDKNICLHHTEDNGACNGDSGGPAIYNNQLIGVANFVTQGCGSESPDGYAKVSKYIDWISDIINKK